MRRRIPSMEALLAFEAAARHLSFTRAASALSLTQSAVCKQIAVLEEYLGVQLFNRVKKRISLTDAGVMYARQVSENLDRLERSTMSIISQKAAGGVLELAVIPTFATRWLIPRLLDFRRANPGTILNLTTRAEPFLFTDTEFDAAIHFGTPVWPGAVTEYLFGEEVVPVCSPRLWEQVACAQPRELPRLTLLHQSSRYGSWRRWFDAAGVHDVDAMSGPRFELFSMLVEAARAGLGVALVPRFFVLAEVASGELMIPFDLSLESEMGYFLVYPEHKQGNASLQTFVEWLREKAAQYRSSLMGAADRLEEREIN